MKFAYLLLLNALTVDAIRMNIRDDGASSGTSSTSDPSVKAAVADIAADVSRLERELAAEAEKKKSAEYTRQRTAEGIATYEKDQADAEARLAARNRNQKIAAKLSGQEVVAHMDAALERVSARAAEVEKQEALDAERAQRERKESELRAKRAELEKLM